uniref:Uncharacterized protein n=1 Tax=Timema tahoe TaxID=61484 RepID=A0A7R9NW55_9NEOP|nr:unnamed protein product [Timema tahoe]
MTILKTCKAKQTSGKVLSAVLQDSGTRKETLNCVVPEPPGPEYRTVLRPCCDCVVLDRFKSDFSRSRSSTVPTQSQHSPISVNGSDTTQSQHGLSTVLSVPILITLALFIQTSILTIETAYRSVIPQVQLLLSPILITLALFIQTSIPAIETAYRDCLQVSIPQVQLLLSPILITLALFIQTSIPAIDYIQASIRLSVSLPLGVRETVTVNDLNISQKAELFQQLYANANEE